MRELTDRRVERGVLDGLVEAVCAGQSRVLVVHGEAGMGKTALLEYLADRASWCRVLRVVGVQSEMELAFAGLHQLCAPLLDQLRVLPGPQREALRAAFGMSAGPAPDRFLVGLASLGLLAEAAAERPVLCLADDAQWLDRASAQVLAFVARRLGAESVGLVFSARVADGELAMLPELEVKGLPERDARALLDAALTGPIDARVREQIVADTRGNPLALLELPRSSTPIHLAGGYGLPGALPGRIEDNFRRRVEALPAQARRLLLLAAADPTGDPVLVWRAAGRLGIDSLAAGPAAEAGLAEFGARVQFRHPLVRSATYRSASAQDRQEAHQVLADATDRQTDPDRRAWHRAQAAAGPDEEAAAELEDSAERAQARGGLAAAAAFGERAALLTPDPARRAGRTLAAAQASLRAGAFGKALELLAVAEAGPLDELQGARADWLRGQIAFASGPGSDAPLLLLKAAKRLEPFGPGLARETYLDAWQAALFAGHLAGGDLEEVSHAAQALPSPERSPRVADLLLDGLAVLVTDGPAVAAPALRRAISAFADPGIPVADRLRWSWWAPVASLPLWDDEGYHLIVPPLQFARDVGALDQLPMLLNVLAVATALRGDLAAAASLIAEADAARDATGARLVAYAAMVLAAFRGSKAEAVPLIEATLEQAAAVGQGAAVTWAHWVAAVLHNGLGRYQEALTAARQAAGHKLVHLSMWALPELVVAAARTGNTALARDALDQLSEWTQAGRTDWGLGVEARSRALLSEGEAADRLYLEAIDRLGRTGMRPDLARAHLLYGEWLRRQRRRGEARVQLRTAHGLLDAMGMEGFAARARHELRATGETARKRSVATMHQLTAQEAQIAWMARDGLSNPEIGARLFLSPRTVQYHLGKVFTKLDITSRSDLRRILPADSDAAPRSLPAASRDPPPSRPWPGALASVADSSAAWPDDDGGVTTYDQDPGPEPEPRPAGGGPDAPRLIARGDVLAALDRAAARKVTVISAPAGSGKTSLLGMWADQLDRGHRIAVVSVRRDQEDAQEFWLALLNAVRHACGTISDTEPPAAAPDLNVRTLVDRVLRELADSTARITVVIDDLHELNAPEALAPLTQLLTNLPPDAHAILAARRDMPLRLHRLRLAGELAEIRAADLRFSERETRAFLEASGIALSDAGVTLLHQRSEGWAAGLRLAAISLADHPDPERFVAEFSGSDRTVAEYLVDEMLERQPDNVIDLLLRTCLLDRVNGELADLLTGCQGAERILLELEDANALVVSLDLERTWFRYHHLFADLLRLELRRRMPEKVPALHRRAAGWFTRHGQVAEAIRHTQAAGDWAEAARLLADYSFSLTLDGQAQTMQALLRAFPPGADHPELALVRAMGDLAQGRLDEAAAYLAVAETYAETAPADRQRRLQVAVASLKLSLARRRGHLAGVIEQAKLLASPVTGQSEEDIALGSDLRAVALMNLGTAEAWTLGLPDAERHLREGAALAREIGRPYLEVGCLAQLGFASRIHSFATTQRRCREAIALAERHGWGTEPVIAPALITLAGTMVWTGEFDEGERWLQRTRQALQTDTGPDIRQLLHLATGRLYAGRGRHREALEELDAAERLGSQMEGSHALASQVTGWLLATQARAGMTGEARARLAALDEQEARSGEVRNANAVICLAEGDPAAALSAVASVLDGTAPVIGDITVMETYLLAGLAYRGLGDQRAANQIAERALGLAEADRLVLPFVMTGSRELLETLPRHETSHAALLTDILDIMHGSSVPPRENPAPLARELSPSELRVLRYLPTNLSRPQIAGELSISPHTLNTHLRRIYAKLGADNRSAAVHHARKLRLLSAGRTR